MIKIIFKKLQKLIAYTIVSSVFQIKKSNMMAVPDVNQAKSYQLLVFNSIQIKNYINELFSLNF